MIYITGDTHGTHDIGKLLPFTFQHLTHEDLLIIAGDVAICWDEDRLPGMIELYRKFKCTVAFIDGNHENFDMLNRFPIVDFHGAKAHQLDDHIFHILRGEIFEYNSKTFLCIGGAVSIDKEYREEGISWWKEENITEEDIENARKNLERYDNRVDYVITHCCDSYTVKRAFRFNSDDSTDKLNFIDEGIAYEHWYFAHYHFDQVVDYRKTCLYQRIVEIE